MSFKPLDLQVNISQINHVARTQHHQQAVPGEMQQHQAEHLRKQSDSMQHNVQKSAESSGEGSKVKERDREQHPHGKKQKQQHHDEMEDETGEDDRSHRKPYDDGKGHLVDFTG